MSFECCGKIPEKCIVFPFNNVWNLERDSTAFDTSYGESHIEKHKARQKNKQRNKKNTKNGKLGRYLKFSLLWTNLALGVADAWVLRH